MCAKKFGICSKNVEQTKFGHLAITSVIKKNILFYTHGIFDYKPSENNPNLANTTLYVYCKEYFVMSACRY